MADTFRIYYKREKVYDKELVAIQELQTSARNKELIDRFHNFLFSRRCCKLRVSKVSSQLRRICLRLNKDLDKVNTEDLEKLVTYYLTLDKYSEDTKVDYMRCIKQFYRWFQDNDPRLDSVKPKVSKEAKSLYKFIETIKSTCKLKSVDFSNIITEEEVNQVIEHGSNSVKEKALIRLLHETGARAGELLNIRIKDVVFKEKGGLVVVDGKTGERKVPIVKSVPYLIQWLDIHPFKDSKDSYLWVGESLSRRYEPLKHRGGQKLIDRCFEKAAIKKQHNYHWFRHSRATLLAPKLTEALLCKYMGWVIGSKQVRRYVHLCTEQLETEIMQINGLQPAEQVKSDLPPVCCCGAINIAGHRYCYKCGNPLDISFMIQDKELLKQETDTRLKQYAEIMADPEKRKQFEEFKRIILHS
ncbi:MAG: tyrosine-type recombinase/integrase [Candidatus Woesearchaeota archaeon]